MTTDNAQPGAADNVAPHVLHVVTSIGKGGGLEGVVYQVVAGLARRGVRHSVLLLDSGQGEEELDFGGLAPVYRMRGGAGLAWRISRLIGRIGPTVMHARNLHAWPDAAAARLLGHWKLPLIFSFHGSDLPVLPTARRLAMRALGGVTTAMFAVSRAARDALALAIHLPPSRIGVIHNGVDLRRFSPGGGGRAGGLVVGAVGRLEPVKNHALLLEACAAAASGGIDLELWLAGTGSLQEQLRQHARRLGIADRTKFLGYVADMPALLRRLDIFVLPSRSEGHPNALLEAMACGAACVAAKVGGVSEVVESGEPCALVVPPGDCQALAAAIARLAGDQPLRQALGQAARRRVCQQYDMQTMLNAYERLYRLPRRCPWAEREQAEVAQPC